MQNFMDTREHLNQLSGTSAILLGLGLVALVGSVDYLTGKEINLLLFYLVPVALIAWFMNRRNAFLISIFCASASFVVELLIGHFYSESVSMYWNASLRLTSFMIFAAVLSSMKLYFEENSELVLEIRIALAKINTFTGRNPICAWCQKVRNEEGRWQKFDSYVKEHSITEVTHGICPDCLQQFEKDSI